MTIWNFAVMSVLNKSRQQLKEQMSSRRPHLTKALERIQDFYMEIKWDFQSWGMHFLWNSFVWTIERNYEHVL